MTTIVVTQQGNVLVPSVQQNRIVTPVVQNTPTSAGVTLQVKTASQQTVEQTLQSRTAVPVTTPGPQGPPGTANAPLTCTALTALSYPNVVAVDGHNNAYYPDLSNPADVANIAGVTLHAAAAGAPVDITSVAEFTETNWNWAPGRIFCAQTGGALTQVAPGAPSALLEVARVITPTTIRVGIQPATLR